MPLNNGGLDVDWLSENDEPIGVVLIFYSLTTRSITNNSICFDTTCYPEDSNPRERGGELDSLKILNKFKLLTGMCFKVI